MTSSLLSFIITILIVAVGAATSEKKKKKGARGTQIPKQNRMQTYRNPQQNAPMQQTRWNPQQNTPVQQAYRNSQQNAPVQQTHRNPQQMNAGAIHKQNAVPPKSSGNAILDRVLRENAATDARESEEEEMVILDTMGLGIPTMEQSPYMQEVHQLIVTGYEAKMPEQRDFLMEGLALLNQHVG